MGRRGAVRVEGIFALGQAKNFRLLLAFVLGSEKIFVRSAPIAFLKAIFPRRRLSAPFPWKRLFR